MSDRRVIPPGSETYLTVDEVAAVLKISRWKVYGLLRSGELDSFLVGRCRRVPASALAAMVQRLIRDAA
jgi:excisionase family DNA binding protein